MAEQKSSGMERRAPGGGGGNRMNFRDRRDAAELDWGAARNQEPRKIEPRHLQPTSSTSSFGSRRSNDFVERKRDHGGSHRGYGQRYNDRAAGDETFESKPKESQSKYTYCSFFISPILKTP